MARYIMTKKGYEKLRRQLDLLKEEALIKAQERLGAARELGDLSENSEYDAAREELWRIEAQIGEIEDQVANSEVIDPSKINQSAISLGATVVLEDTNTNEKETWTIVGHGEVDLNDNKISLYSPIAEAMSGKKGGDFIEVSLPAGIRKLKIVSFHYDF